MKKRGRGRPRNDRLNPGVRWREGKPVPALPDAFDQEQRPGETTITPAAIRAIKVRRFVRAFVAGGPGVAGNLAQAALAAGLAKTRGSASFMGRTMMRDPVVIRAVTRQLEAFDTETHRSLEELNRIILTDAREIDEARRILEQGGSLSDIPDHVASVIGEVSTSRTAEGGVSVRVKGYNKLEAIALFAKIKRLIVPATQKVEVSGPGGNPIQHQAVVVYLPANGRDAGETVSRARVIEGSVAGAPGAGSAREPSGSPPGDGAPPVKDGG